MLAIEQTPSIPVVSKVPTIILGMDVSHGSPGQSDIPSIAAVGMILFNIFGFLGFHQLLAACNGSYGFMILQSVLYMTISF